MDDKLDALRDALALEESAGAEAVLVAAKERIEALTADLARGRAEELVALAMRAGKLTESQCEWATALALVRAEVRAALALGRSMVTYRNGSKQNVRKPTRTAPLVREEAISA